MSMTDPSAPDRMARYRENQAARAWSAAHHARLPDFDQVEGRRSMRGSGADWLRFASGLVVPAGHRLAGQPMDIGWFAEPVAAGLDNPDVSRVAVVCARKNGKTAGAGALVVWGVTACPPGWRGQVVSVRRENAARTVASARGLVDALGLSVRVTGSKLTGPAGQECVVAAASDAGGHSEDLDLVVVDEPGLMRPRHAAVVGAFESALGARDGLAVFTSIRGDSALMEEVLADEDAIVRLYEAPRGCALDDEAAWAAANPGLGAAKSYAFMRREVRKALRSPSAERRFRSQELNQRGRVDVRDELLAPERWAACQRPELPAREGPCTLGLDLGGSWSLTAAVAYWPRTGRLECQSAVPSVPDLEARGTRDGDADRYVRAAAAGRLWVHDGLVVDGRAWSHQVRAWSDGWDVRGCGADRYRRSEVLTALGPDWPVTVQWRGTGRGSKADGSADVRAFQTAALSGRLAVDQADDVLGAAVRDCRLTFDAGGNPALDKSRWTARIDAAQAAVIAVGLAAALGLLVEDDGDVDDWIG